MLSIIDEMLIGLVWKLEVGVKWGGVEANERAEGGERGILGYQ